MTSSNEPSSTFCVLGGCKPEKKGDITADTQLIIDFKPDQTVQLNLNPLFYGHWNGIKPWMSTWMSTLGPICLTDSVCLDAAKNMVTKVEKQYNERILAKRQKKIRGQTKIRRAQHRRVPTDYCHKKFARRLR